MRKRSIVYSGFILTLALAFSAALLQLSAYSAVKAAPLPPSNEFSVTVVKDAIPDSTQSFTVIVQIGVMDLTVQAAAVSEFQLVDDSTGISNTKTITALLPLTETSLFIDEMDVDNWRHAGTLCRDAGGAPVDDSTIQANSPITCTVTNLAPAITLSKTVGTDPSACASTDVITVAEGSAVNYCYTVQNTGGVSLTIHSLLDDQLDTLLDEAEVTLPVGASFSYSKTATVPVTTTNVATWTAWMTYSASPPVFVAIDDVAPVQVYTLTAVATDTATVYTEPPAPGIALTKTVGTLPGVCAANDSIDVQAGTQVYYCYTVMNTGNIALPLHQLQDSDQGEILPGLAYTLTQGSSVNTVTAGVTVSKTATVDVTNVATWTAYISNSLSAPSVTAVDAATVTVSPGKLYLPQLSR